MTNIRHLQCICAPSAADAYAHDGRAAGGSRRRAAAPRSMAARPVSSTRRSAPPRSRPTPTLCAGAGTALGCARAVPGVGVGLWGYQ